VALIFVSILVAWQSTFGIFAHVADEMTVAEAAAAIGTSTQTIRNFLGDRTLSGRRGPRGWWLVERTSVVAFLEEHGRLAGGRRRHSPAAALQAEVERLRREVDRLSGLATNESDLAVAHERDEVRSRVVALEDNLAQMRETAELQRRADAERDEVIEHLLAAVAAEARAGALRRQAVEELEAALARNTLPGHLGQAS
jgi:hypothetical protein